MVEQGVVVLSTYQGTGEHDCVEGNIVFSHELVELHLFWVLPPSLPLLGVAGSDGEVPRGEQRNMIEGTWDMRGTWEHTYVGDDTTYPIGASNHT